MRIDPKTAKTLTEEDARDTMQMLRHLVDNPLALKESLLGFFPKKIAEAAAELMQLRERSVQKFTEGLDMFFTKEQLEQSSSEKVAEYRAKRFQEAGFSEVYDVCCGIGSDTTAFARAGLKVFASDKDESTLHYAQTNAEVRGIADRVEFQLLDCTEESPGSGPIFIDPARRRGSRRIMSPDDWSPNPKQVAELIKDRPGAGIKLSPAVAIDLLLEKFPKPDEIEVISLHGEAKETFFWYGKLASGQERRATVLPVSESFAGVMDRNAEVGELGDYLHDPDPSLVCSELLGGFAKQSGLRVLDPEIAYLTGDKEFQSPFLDSFKVLGKETLDPRKMRKVLVELEVGRLEIRKRGIAERPLTLQQRFLPKPNGDRTVTLIATRVGESHVGILGERLE